MSTVQIPEDIQAMKFEEAQAEIESLIRQIDNGGMPLEKTTDCFIRCCMLSRHCHNILAELEKKVVIQTAGKEGWEDFLPNQSRSSETAAAQKTASAEEDDDDFSADDNNENSLL